MLMIHCFRDVTPYRLVNSYRRFGEAWCFVLGQAATLLGVRDPEDGDTTILLNVGKCLPVDMV
jgi:hypothetical protein